MLSSSLAQFSFVRHGEFPAIATASAAWGKAQAIARLAVANVVPSVDTDVLWYHATMWLLRGVGACVVEKIGAHLLPRLTVNFGGLRASRAPRPGRLLRSAQPVRLGDNRVHGDLQLNRSERACR